MFFFIAVIAAIIVTVAYPVTIGQTVFIVAQKTLTSLAHVHAANFLVTSIHTMIDSVTNQLHWQTETVLRAGELFIGAIELLVVRCIVFAIMLIIIARTIVVAVATKIVLNTCDIIVAHIPFW